MEDNKYVQKPMTIKDIISILWRNKYLLMIFIVGGLLISLVAGFIANRNSSKVSTIIELQWSNLTLGQYPDGQKFDYSNLFESYVYSAALDDIGNSTISSLDLRNATSITPIVPNSVLEMIENELRKGNQLSYYATVYKVTIEHGSLGIKYEAGEELINRIIEQFRQDFERKYVQGTVITNYLLDDYSTYDYLQTYNILKSQVSMIKNAVNQNLPVGAKFISTGTNLSFNDVLVQTSLVESNELLSIGSRITNYLLSKDQELLLHRLYFENEINQVQLNIKQDQKTDLENMIATYPGSTVQIIIPGVDTTKTLKFDTYIDSLYKELIKRTTEVSELSNNITYNQVLIDRLEGKDPDYIVTPEEQAEQSAIVVEEIAAANQKLAKIVEDFDVLLREYREYSNRALVKQIVTPQHESDVSYLLFAIVGVAIGGSIGLLVVFIMDANQKSKKIKSIAS